MIADIQTKEVLVLSLEQDIQYTIVQDLELAHVGGGSGLMSF
jgi:hypothetical protein